MRPAPRIFDAHLHIVDPAFPLIANEGYVPEPFTVDDYRAATAGLEVIGGAVVSGSFQGFDTTYLLTALDRLGPAFVGVAQLPVTVADEELRALDAAGVRAIRCNLRRSGSEGIEALETLAARVFELVGWHVELYVEARELGALEDRLRALPAVCIDHLGLTADGFDVLVRLVAGGGTWVKASGFGRVEGDVAARLRELHAAAPEVLIFGTDLPSTRAPRPFRAADVALVQETLA